LSSLTAIRPPRADDTRLLSAFGVTDDEQPSVRRQAEQVEAVFTF
jgi:hypothetical protein